MRPTRVTPLLVLLVLLVSAALLAGCQNDETAAPEAPEPPTEPIAEEEVMPAEPPQRNALDRAVDMARRDLAARLDSGDDAIRVVDARQVTWRDGALGCPEEDMMYTQALVDGFYILLEFQGERHAYHAGRDGVPFACPAERSQPPARRDRDDHLR